MAKAKSAAASADKIERWKLVTDYVESCNCNFGRPCNFSGYPTNGFCEAIVGYHIRDGNYGQTKLGGVDVIYVAAWPKSTRRCPRARSATASVSASPRAIRGGLSAWRRADCDAARPAAPPGSDPRRARAAASSRPSDDRISFVSTASSIKVRSWVEMFSIPPRSAIRSARH